MSTGSGASTVLVAVGVGEETTTVEWAAAEAAERGCRLLLVHVLPASMALEPMAMGAWTPVVPPPPAVARDVLDCAARAARGVAPHLDVVQRVLSGPTVHMVAQASRGAALLVVGESRRRPRRRVLDRSLTHRLVARSPCPVVVVGSDRLDASHSGRPRIVVAVGCPPLDAALLRFAFRAAGRRGLPLVVIRTWAADPPADLEGVCGPEDATGAHAEAAIRQALAPWSVAYPQVEVELRSHRGDPAVVVAGSCQGAALTVVGRAAPRVVPRGWFDPAPWARIAGRVSGPVAVVSPLRRRATPAGLRQEQPVVGSAHRPD